MHREFDVVVIGGGPAGAATALSLLQKGHSVLVIERARNPTIRYGETLVPRARRLLVQLGVWEQFLQEGHEKSYGIFSAWGRDDLYENNFMFNPFGNGWHLDRPRFDRMLLNASARCGGLVLNGAKVSRFSSAGGRWNLNIQIKDQVRQFRSRFLVDATGRSSLIAAKMGARRILCDHLVGIIAFFQTDTKTSTLRGHTLVEAQKHGWWYSAELPGCRTVLAFMTDADIYARAIKHSPDFWMEQLRSSKYTKECIVLSRIISKPQPVASCTSRIDPVAGDNWVAVGDAAISFDPLSSQGIYRAMESGINAAESIHNKLTSEEASLESYSHSADVSFEKYTSLRKFYYFKEQRWPESSFWKRRHLA